MSKSEIRHDPLQKRVDSMEADLHKAKEKLRERKAAELAEQSPQYKSLNKKRGETRARLHTIRVNLAKKGQRIGCLERDLKITQDAIAQFTNEEKTRARELQETEARIRDLVESIKAKVQL